MERQKVANMYRIGTMILFLLALGVVAFAAGFTWSRSTHAAEPEKDAKVVYPKKTDLDFDGMGIEGEIRNPGEFYFQHRKEEKFDSLVKRRSNFHREMQRDAVLGK